MLLIPPLKFILACVFCFVALAMLAVPSHAHHLYTLDSTLPVGVYVELDGNTAVRSDAFETVNGVSEAGAVYVYIRAGSGWVLQARLTASDPRTSALFGWSVDVDGDTMVVGVGGSSPRAAYVFERTAGVWNQVARLTRLDGGNTHFGISVSVSGDTIVVGDGPSSFAGTASVYVRPGTGWVDATENASLIPSDSHVNDRFGWSVAIDGDTVVVGAFGQLNGGIPGVDQPFGAVYVYERPPVTGWVGTLPEVAKLTGTGGFNLGRSVDISGSVIVGGANVSSYASVWQRGAGAWGNMTSPTARLSVTAGWNCCSSVSIDGDTIATFGVSFDKPLVFKIAGTTWADTTEFDIITGTTNWRPIVSGDQILGGHSVFVRNFPEFTLGIEKIVEPFVTVGVGAPLTYTITVTNQGPEDAPGVTLTDTLPPGVTVVAPLPPQCGEASGTVTCDLGTLATGNSVEIVLATLAPATPGTIVNTATATSTIPFPAVSSSVAIDVVIISDVADVRIDDKAANFSEVEAGEELFAYSIHFSNDGPGPATGAILIDPLPDGMLFEHVTTTEGDCSHDVATNTVNCALGDLPPGRVGLVMISATPVQVGLISNTASIMSTASDPLPENNVSSAETHVLFSRASVTDTVNVADDRLLDFGLVAVGQSASGSLSVTNIGTTPLSIGNILDPLQPPFSVVSAGCFGAVLLPGDSCGVIIQFLPTENGSFSDGFDLQLDSIVVPVAVSGAGGLFSTDITITKDADVHDVSVGDVVNFTVTVSNRGIGTTGGVTAAVKVTDKLPAPLRIPNGEAATVSQGFYVPSTGEWFVGDLAVGQPPATLEIPAEVTREPPGGRHCITNVAVAEITNPDVTDNRLSNNRAERMISIGGCADVSVGSDVDQEFEAYLPLDRDYRRNPLTTEQLTFRFDHQQYPLGYDCGECDLDFTRQFPDVRYIGYVIFREWGDDSRIVVLNANLRNGTSGAFHIHANPGSCTGIISTVDYCIEISFRSSELGSDHSGVLEIQYVFVNDPFNVVRVAEVNLVGSIVEDFGTVQFDFPLFNDGPGAFRTPFVFLVDTPFGTTFNTFANEFINTDSFKILNDLDLACEVELITSRGEQQERLICTATSLPPRSFECRRESPRTCRIGVLTNVHGVFGGGMDMSFCSVTEDPQHNNNGRDSNVLFGREWVTAGGLTMECPR